MKSSFRRVIYVYERFGGGATMGCYQPCHVTNTFLKQESYVLEYKELLSNLNDYKNDLLIFFKKNPHQQVSQILKQNNCVVLYYVGDMTSLSLGKFLRSNAEDHLSGVIVGSKDFKKIVSNNFPNLSVEVIPANHDIFLEKTNKFKHKSFSLYFGGSLDSRGYMCQGDLGLRQEWNYTSGYFHPLRDLINKTSNGTSIEKYGTFLKEYSEGNHHDTKAQVESFDSPLRYSCHYAVRAPLTLLRGKKEKLNFPYDQWVTKTGGKVSTAAACNSNIITSLDPANRELIDESYPYDINTESEYFMNNWSEICNEMKNKAQKDFGNKTWKEGLKIMKDVKEKTRTEVIVKRYIEFGEKVK